MKLFSSTVALAAALTAVPALADPGFYLGASVGAVSAPDQNMGAGSIDTETGGDLSFYLGYDFDQIAPWGGVRADLQLSGQAAEADGEGSPEYLAAMTFVNVYADFDKTGQARWVPYLGFGIGHGDFKFDDYASAGGKLQDETGSAWGAQATLGVSYHATDNVRLFADIRHAMFADVDLRDGNGEKTSLKPRSTSLNAGLAYHF